MAAGIQYDRMTNTWGTPEQIAEQYALRQEGTRTQAGEWGLQREKEAWELQKKQSGVTADLTKQFLSQWGVGMESLKDLYSQILGGDGGTAGPIGDLSKKVLEEYESFKTEYAPLQKQFFEQAGEELGVRKEMIGQLKGLAIPDYEGAAGRAKADVAGQSEMARQAESRRLMSLGLDPTSGKFGALTKKGYLDEARNTAIAMNLARRGEKERVTGITGQAIELADPRIASSIGLGLQEQQTGMLKTTADLARAQADIEGTRAGVVSSYAKDVVSPYGQVGFTLLGQQIGQGTYQPGMSAGAGIPAESTAGAPRTTAIPDSRYQTYSGYVPKSGREKFRAQFGNV
jgi:hypothetical protein